MKNGLNKIFFIRISFIFGILVSLLNFTSAVSMSVNMDVIEVNDPKFTYINIDDSTFFGSTLIDSVNFIKDVYPVSEDGLDFSEIVHYESIDSSKIGRIFIFKVLEEFKNEKEVNE